MRFVVNRHAAPADVPPPVTDAMPFHRALPGYEPTPVRELPAVARSLGIAAVLVKDESSRLGLPAFKILGASWAAERALAERPESHTLVAASAGNHGRAVARVAAMRGLRCRIFLPARALPVRREAIEGEGAEVVVVAGPYEDAVAAAEAEARQPGALLIADVGSEGPPAWVVDGYATLLRGGARASGLRPGARAGRRGLARRRGRSPRRRCRDRRDRRRTGDGGMPDGVARVGSAGAGRHARHGHGGSRLRAVSELEAHGLEIGESGAAPLAALRVLDDHLRSSSRVLLVATEGRTGSEPPA